MSTPPYIHVATTPISLVGDLSIPFTPIEESQSCIVYRDVATTVTKRVGHWDAGDSVSKSGGWLF